LTPPLRPPLFPYTTLFRSRSLAQNKGVPPLNVAQLLVKCLENEGVRHVFGIPGEETLALNAALDDSSKIRFVLTRHEQGAAFMRSEEHTSELQSRFDLVCR